MRCVSWHNHFFHLFNWQYFHCLVQAGLRHGFWQVWILRGVLAKKLCHETRDIIYWRGRRSKKKLFFLACQYEIVTEKMDVLLFANAFFDCSWFLGHLSHGCGDRCTTDRVLCTQLLSEAAIPNNRLHAALRWSGSVLGVWQLAVCPGEGGGREGGTKAQILAQDCRLVQVDSTNRISMPTVVVHQSNPTQTKGSNKIS